MNDPKLKITLELSGQEKIEEFLAKLSKKYNLEADADLSNIAKEIQKNIESPLNKQISAFNSFKTKAMQFGLVMNGVSGAISGAMMLYKATIGAVVDSAAEFEQLKLRLVSLYQDTDKAAAAFEKFRTIASNTPATLKGVVEAGASLKAFGLEAEDVLESVADLAAYMGLDIVEAAQAVGRAFAGGVVTEEEKKLLEMYRKRGQAAQLAVNRDSDVAAYYDEIRFHDSSYYAWKKARIEEDVRLMDISEEQKAALIKAKLDALKLEMQDFKPDKSLFDNLLDALDIPTEHQAKIKSSFQFLANQISSIWSQLYSNLASNRDQSLADLEHRAKKERKTDAWLAKEKDRINEEYEKKHRSLKRTEQKMQIASATANTLEGITNALTVKPAWLAPIMAASVGALGFAQVKLIAEQKFATGGHFRGRGSSTSDSNIIAVSDNEYIVSADRVNRFGVPFFDALNFGNGEQIRKALSSIRIPTPSISYPAKTHGYASGGVVRPQAPVSQNVAMNVVLKCDGKALAKAVMKGTKKIIST